MLKITKKFVSKGYYKYNYKSKTFYLNAKDRLTNYKKSFGLKLLRNILL